MRTSSSLSWKGHVSGTTCIRFSSKEEFGAGGGGGVTAKTFKSAGPKADRVNVVEMIIDKIENTREHSGRSGRSIIKNRWCDMRTTGASLGACQTPNQRCMMEEGIGKPTPKSGQNVTSKVARGNLKIFRCSQYFASFSAIF